MQLQSLNISNFRCFKEYTLQFLPGINILYGLNGAGKTTLIQAICKALSFVMASDTTSSHAENKETLSIANGGPNLKVEGYSSKGDFYIAPSEDGGKTTQADIMIDAHGDLDGTPIHWAISASSKPGSNLRKTAYMDAFRTFWKWHMKTDKLPVLAYYSDGFPHVKDQSQVSESVASLRNFGYYDWSNGMACSVIWLERMERTLKERERLERRKSGLPDGWTEKLKALNEEVRQIESCFKRFSKGDAYIEVDSLELSSFDDSLCVRTTQGKLFAFRKLPAGYKRLLYMVLDIAYRSYILNRTVAAEGIVIIDEIDLHLHPGLERVVLNRFQDVFPGIQFIISTHSPLVITSMKTDESRNRIYRMEPDSVTPTVVSDVYGLDYNSGIENVMLVPADNESLSRMVETCAYMRYHGQDKQAGNISRYILDNKLMSEARLERLIADRLKAY
jgi:hypothetical protein